MNSLISLPELAANNGLGESLINAAVIEASSLLQIVLGGGNHHASTLAGEPANPRGMDPIAETLALFNADWRGALK